VISLHETNTTFLPHHLRSKKEASFLKAFEAQATAALSTAPSLTPTSTKTGNSITLFTASSAHAAAARHVLTTYMQACTLFSTAASEAQTISLGEGWDSDFETVKDLLKLGQRVAQRQIDGLEGSRDAGKGFSEEEVFMLEGQLGMRGGNGSEGGGATFHDLLRDAERGVLRMTRGLGGDVDELGEEEGEEGEGM